ncbi:MAG TPA: SdrD B-like domain-containing protein, partial [Anaerolineales bacterium]|nr:SdrD B-like domain-containing protein [Anaerolineales bacterium]
MIIFLLLLGGLVIIPTTLAFALSFSAEINQSFTPIKIVAGDTSRLDIKIYNPNEFQLDNVSFTDSLIGVQPGLKIATPANLANDCGGIVIADAGTTTIRLSGGSVPPQVGSTAGTCTISVDVTSTTPGNLINTIPAYAAPAYGGVGLHATARGGLDTITNTSPASATVQITEVEAPSMNKSFTPNTVWTGQSSQLEIDIINNDLQTALDHATFTDYLPASFTVAAPLTVSLNGCGEPTATLAASVGATSFTLNNGTIAPDSTCQIRIRVVSSIQGTYTNTIGAGPAGLGSLQTRQGVTNKTPVTADINVQAVNVAKAFSPTTISQGDPTNLTITLTNPSGADYTGIGLVDNLPPGLAIYGTPASFQCGGAVTSTSNSLTLVGGVIPAGSILSPGTCQIHAQVTGTAAGLYTNTIPAHTMTGPVTNAFPASANLTVRPRTIGVVKRFGSAYFFAGGTTSLTVTLQNRTAFAFTGVDFTDNLPSPLQLLGTPTTSPSCGAAATISTTNSSFHLSQAIIPPGTDAVPGTCVVTALVTSPDTGGPYMNIIPAHTVTSAEGISNDNPASTSVTVFEGGSSQPATITKYFSPNSVPVGSATRLIINILTPIDTPLSGIYLADTLPAGLLIAGAPNPPASDTCGGTLTAVPGTRQIELTGGEIPYISSLCTISVYVTATAPGNYTNTIPGNTLASFEGRTDPITKTAFLTATDFSVSKSFTPSIITNMGLSRLTISLRNTNLVPIQNVMLTDDLSTMGGNSSFGVFVAPDPNATTTCGSGQVRAIPGSKLITMGVNPVSNLLDPSTAGTVPAGDGVVPGLCTISVNVQGVGVDPITRTNTISTANVTGNLEGIPLPIHTVAAATADLTISTISIQIVKGFDPVAVFGGTSSLMSIKLVNPDLASLSGIHFTDTMPDKMILANPVQFNVGTCGGTLSGTPGGNSFSFSGGYLPASSDCTLTLRVTMTVIGNLTNTIAAGDVTTFEGVTNPQDTSASLTNLPGAEVSKAFSPNPVPAGGVSLLTITVTNTGNVALTGMGMNDPLPGTLPAGLEIADSPAAVNNCGGTLTAVPGSQTIQLANGVLADDSICTIVVPVTSTVPNAYLNRIPEKAITTDQGRTNNEPAEDTLVVTSFSLGNRVWNDNGAGGGVANNGVRDGSEPGLAGVTANLYLDSNDDGTPDGSAIATTTTDADGFYRFDGLAAGNYIVEVVPPSGYIPSTVNGGDADANPTDDDNNGVVTTAGGNVRSYPVTLGPGADEPTGETNPTPNPLPGEAPDDQSNRTVDFGLFQAFSLGNRVWLDNGSGAGGIANNGFLDGTEPGIQNVRVNLYRDSNADGIPDGAAIAYTLTDADGYYRFDRLVAGTYIVEVVTPDGYTNTEQTAGTDTNTVDNDNNGMVEIGSNIRSNPVTLGPSLEPTDDNDPLTNPESGEALNEQSNRTVDFGFTTGYSLGNRVWFDNGAGTGGIADNGIQDGTEPGLDGVTVNLYRDSNADDTPDGPAIATTTTAGGGYYRFDGLIADSYIVEAAIPTGYRSSSVSFANPNDDQDKDNNGVTVSGGGLTILSNHVTLGPGGSEPLDDNDPATNPLPGEAANDYSNRTVDFGFYYIPYSLGNRVWDDNGAGTGGIANDGVRNGTEPGLAGMTAYLYRDSDNNGIPDGSPIAFAITDSSGYYRFDYLRADTYIVEVVTPAGYTSSAVRFSNTTYPAVDDDNNGVVVAGNRIRSNPVTLGPGAVEPSGETDLGPVSQPGDAPDLYSNLTVDFSFVQLASLGDRVWYDSNHDGIQDSGEAGVPGVTVKLYTDSGTLVATTTSGGGGLYVFTGLVPGNYYEIFTPPTGYVISPKNQGTDAALDSDADTGTGKTVTITLGPGQNDTTWDAGMYQPLASLGDFVWNDANRNGIQDAAETGIQNVRVDLYRPGYGPDGIPFTADDSNIVDTQHTDANGKYLFSSLIPGNYYLVFTPPTGYAISPQNAGSDTTVDSDANPATYQTAVTTLVSGETDLTWDAGMYSAPASLGDYVWLDANGNGVQDSGESGIAGATVDLYRPGFGPDGVPGTADDADQLNALPVTTAGDGLYSFTGLTPGVYDLTFTPPAGYALTVKNSPGGTATTDSDANPSSGQTDLITLAPDQNDVTWDAGVYQPAALGDFVWNDVNRNGIQDAGEAGVNGVQVDLYTASGTLVATTHTANLAGVDGTYGFSRLLPGSYRVVFTPPAGYALSPKDQGSDNTKDSDANPVTGQTDVLTLTSGQTDLTWDAGLYQLASVGDRVWNDNGAGAGGIANDGIQNGTEPGLDGVTVRLYTDSGSLVATTATSGGGIYGFSNLVPGNYYLVFTPPAGYTLSPMDQGSDNAKDSDADTVTGQTATFTLTPGENDTTWDAGMYVGPATLGDFVWFDSNGNGTQDAGEPGINGVTVKLYDDTDHLLGTTVTANVGGVDGKYSFTNLTPGYYYLVFTTPSGYSITLANQGSDHSKDSDAIAPTGQTNLIPLAAGQTDLTWDAGYTKPVAIGNLVWLDNGAGGGVANDGIRNGSEPGIAGVTVQLFTAGNILTATTFTNSSGYYYFDNVFPGDYYVTIPASMFAAGKPLAGYVSSSGAGSSPTADQNVDENGIDDLLLATNGIRTRTYSLQAGNPALIPTGEDQSGYTGSLADNQVNATVDFGFTKPIVFTKTLTGTEITAAGNNAADQAAIGEAVTYTLTTTFGQNITSAARIVDTLDPGLAFMDVVSITATSHLSSTRMTFDGSGACTNCTAGTNAATSNPYIQNSGGTVTFDFGDVTNSNLANSSPETITVVYRAVVLNTSTNQSGTKLNNSAVFTWTGLGAAPITDATPDVTVVEPVLQTTKSVVVNGSGTSGEAGDPVQYTIVLSHAPASETDAYDVTFTDSIPTDIRITGFTVNDSGTVSPVTASAFTLVGNTLRTISSFDFPYETGRTITITVNGELRDSVTAGQLISNTAGIQWTSLPGPYSNRSAYNPDSDERDGFGAPSYNDYFTSASADLTITDITPAKSIVSSSNADTLGTDLAIGEVERYRLAVDIPQGTQDAFTINDTLPLGIVYAGNPKISFIDDSGMTLAADLTGSTQADNGALPPTYALPAAHIAVSGQDLTFNLGNIVNNDVDSNTEKVVVEFDVRADDDANNHNGDIKSNAFTVTINALSRGTSNTVSNTIVEPDVTTTKSVSPTSGVQAGDTLTYTVRFTNTGTSPAYDVTAEDTLAQGVAFDSVTSCTYFDGSSSAAILASSSVAGNVVTFDGSPAGGWDLPVSTPHAYIECVYTAKALGSLYLDGSHTNTIAASWTSLDGPDANERSYTGPDVTSSFTSGAPAIAKSDGGTTQATIGQTIDYTLTLTSPLGTLHNAVITDTLPKGMIYAAGSQSVGSGISAAAFTATGPTDGSDTVSLKWDFGDAAITSSPVTITFQARVANTAYTNDNLDLNNHVDLAWTNVAGAGQTDGADDGFKIVEPALNITKAASVTPVHPDAGDVVTYTVNISPAAGSHATAYDVRITDPLPASYLTLDLPPVVTLTGGASGVTDNSSGNTVDITIDSIASSSANVQIVYTATLKTAVTPGLAIPNTASVVWTSLAGDHNPGAADGERDGSGGINDYSRTDSASVTTSLPSMTKTLVSTELNVPGNDLLTQAAIGELVTYDLVITVPEGTTPALRAVDTLDAGLAFVHCVSVTPSAGLSTSLPGGFSAASVCNDGTTPGTNDPLITSNGGVATYDFGTVTNTNTDNATPETITVQYTVLVTNVAGNQNTGTSGSTGLANSAVLSWTGGSQSPVSASHVKVVEPALTINKSILAAGSDAGDTTTYSVTVANGNAAGDTNAYDAVFRDVLPTGLTYTAGSAAAGTCSAGAPVFAYDGGTRTLTATWATFPRNSSCTITFDTTLDIGVYPGQTIAANIGEVRWTSIPGTRSDASPYNTDSDERTGPAGAIGSDSLNDYGLQNSTGTFTTANVATQKAVVASSEVHTSGTNVTIGEIVRYRLVLQLPEGTVTDLQLADLFGGTGAGQRFLDSVATPATTKVLFVGGGGVSSAAYGSIPAVACANYSGTFTLAQAADPAQIPSSAVNCSLADGNISTSETANSDVYGTNTTMHFGLGTVTNSDSDSNPEFVILEFNALVTNETNNIAGRSLTDSFQARRYDGSAMTNLGSASAATTLTIREPNIPFSLATNNKTASPTSGDAGDQITYTVTYTAANGANNTDAFDVRLLDNLASLPLSGLAFDPASDISYNASCSTPGTPVNDTSVAMQLDVTIPHVAPGCQVTINYRANLTSAVVPHQTVTNTAALTYTSLPGTGTAGNPTGSNTPGASGASNGERDGSGGINTYHGTDTADVTVNNVAPVKSIVSTSETGTPETGDGSDATINARLLAIGETMRYRLTVTLPEGTSNNFVLADTLPAGLSYLGDPRLSFVADTPMTVPGDLAGADNDALPPTFAIPGTHVSVSGQNVSFPLGNLVNNDSDPNAEYVVVEFNVLVNNDSNNYNGTVHDNRFSVSINGGSAVLSNHIYSAVVEPKLQVVKTVDDATPAYGQTITYTLNVSHSAASKANAYDIVVTDTIPSGLSYVPASAGPAGWSPSYNSGTRTLTWTCSSSCSLLLGDTAALTYQVSVNGPPAPPAIGDTLTNAVAMTWTSLDGSNANERTGVDGPSGLNNYATSTSTGVVVTYPDLTITKTDGAAQYVPGASVTYTVTVSNVGNDIASGATVTDNFPAVVTSTSWTCAGAGGATCSAGGTGNISDTVTIPAGQHVTYTVVAQTDPAATTNLVNTATVAPPTGLVAPTPANDTSTDTDTPNPQADLSTTKTDGAAQYVPGTSVTYTVTLANAGPSNAPASVASDTIPAQLSNWTWTCTGATGGATGCDGAASNSSNFTDTVDLPTGSSITYTVVANIKSSATGNLVNTASITPAAGVTDTNLTNNTATDTDTQHSQVDLSTTKTDGTAQYVPGMSVTYTVTVGNAGPSDAPASVVSDAIPAQLSNWTWTCTGATGGATGCDGAASNSVNFTDTINLPTGSSITYTVVANIKSSATGNLVNTASITPAAGITETNAADNTATDTDTQHSQVDVSITKTDGSATYIPGASVTYTITVSNSGPSDATGTTVTDTFPATVTSDTWTCAGVGGATCTASGAGNLNTSANIPAGQHVTYTVTANITSSATGDLVNTATVAHPADTDGTNNSATDTDTQNSRADLRTTKTDGIATYIPGSSVTYTVVVRNTGPSDALASVVTDNIPAQLSSWTWACAGVTGGATGCDAAASNSVNFTDTVNLPSGSTMTYTVTANIKSSATGNLVNTASIAPAAGITDPTPGNNSATDTDTQNSRADLSVTKTDSVAQYVPGMSVTYTVTVANSGPSDALASVVTDNIPTQLSSWAWACSGVTGGATGCDAAASNSINFTDTVDLPSGSSLTYTVAANIKSSATGNLVNTATVAAAAGVTETNAANNTATDTDTQHTQVDLSITKTDGVAQYVPGTSVTYTITVSNSGPSDATGATVTDSFPAGVTATWTCAGVGGATCTASGSGNLSTSANIPAGQHVTYTVTANIVSSLTGDLVNTATVAHPADTNSANNSATDTDTQHTQVDLSVTKTDGVTQYVPGQSVTYTITVANSGPSDATGATVTDSFPAGVTAAWTCTGSGTATCAASGTGNINDTVNIPAGQHVTYTVTANILSSLTGDLVNTATVAHPADTDNTNNSATDTDTQHTQVDLSVTKTDGVTQYVPGQGVTYTVTVANSGPSDATGATVTDSFPAGVTAAWTCAGVGGATCTASGSGNIGDTVDIPAGQHVTYTVTANIASTLTGDLVNTATVAHPADTNSANNSATDTDTQNSQVDLSVTKDDGVTQYVPGMSVTYTVTIVNSGPSAAPLSVVSDSIPAQVASWTWTCTGATGGATGCNGAAGSSTDFSDTVNLPSGSSLTYTVVANIQSSATGDLVNTATIAPASGITDTNSANNSASDTDTQNSQTDLGITKTDNRIYYLAVDTLNYVVVVTNYGPADVTGAVVSDAMPTQITGWTWSCAPATPAAYGCDGGTSAPFSDTIDLPAGASITYNVSAGVTATPSGDLVNTATVTSPVTDTNPANNTASDTDGLAAL